METTAKKQNIKNAFILGVLCSVSYLAVYFVRNILGTVTPQIIETTDITAEYIGSISSAYLIFYAVGQLINGVIGDKLKARDMMSFGLILAGICNFLFPFLIESKTATYIVYGMTGFFLSMIYAPMTKVIAENVDPLYAPRCSLGYNFASLFGSPIAGVAAFFLSWILVFTIGSIALWVMGILCFVIFILLEKKGIVKYNVYTPPKNGTGGIKLLIKNSIIKFTVISVITGVVRTAVVFWMPTYISQHLGFQPETASLIFTVATLVISLSAFISVFVYEKLKRNMDLSLIIFFVLSAVSFLLVYLLKSPVPNIIFLIIAILSSNCAASILWTIYCPSLRDTGMVSSATGFLDFMSYIAAAAANIVFANAASSWGWGNLILVWFGLMFVGVLTCVIKRKKAGF